MAKRNLQVAEDRTASGAKLIRWTATGAEPEFKVDQHTIAARLKSGSFLPGEDGKYSTHQICSAIFGNIHGERLRNERLDADIKQKELDEMNSRLIPVESVQSAWEFIIVNLRQRIWHHQKLSDEVKRGLLEELKSIPVEEYTTKTS